MGSSKHEQYESAPGGRVSGWLDCYCERGILALVLVTLVYAALAWGAVRLTEFAVVQGATVLVLLLWVIRLWANRSLRLFWPPICWAVLAFVTYAIFRCHYVEIAYPARQELNHVLVYAALFLAVVNNVNRRDYTTLICLTLIALGAALSIVAIYQFAGHSPPIIWGHLREVSYGHRGSGTFVNPNNFAGLIELIAPIALAYALMGRFKPVAKVLLGYAVCLLVAGVCSSISRMGMAVTGLSLSIFLVVLLFQPGYRIRAVIILSAILLAGAVGLHKADTIQRRFAQTSYDLNSRSHLWSMAYQLYQKDVVWGIGPEQYNYKFWPYNDAKKLRMLPGYVHNDHLQTLCEWGAVGVVLIAAALILLFLGVQRTWSYVRRDPTELGSRNSTKAAFVLGAAFGLLSLIGHSFADFNMHIPAVALVTITLMAQLSVQLRFATERYWVNPRILGRCVLTLGALTMAAWTANEAQRGFREGFYLNQAHSQAEWNQLALAALRRAAEIEPTNPNSLLELGDCLRSLGDQALPEDSSLSKEALIWLERAAKVDPYHPYIPMRYGMCLDSLGRHDEAAPYFERACALEPRGNVEPLYQGRHYIILENYPAADEAIHRSLKNYYTKKGEDYLFVIADRLARIPRPASPK